MPTTVDNSFIKDYNTDVHHVFQRMGSLLFNACRTKTNVVGYSTTFQKLGKGSATTKARHGLITPMNPGHTAVECVLADFYAPEYSDRLDEAKQNIDERMALAKCGAAALGRKIDEQITTALDSTSETAVSVTVTSKAAVRAGLLTGLSNLWDNDVPNDGQCYGVLTPRLWTQLSQVGEFSSTDWVGPNGLPFVEGAPIGRFKNWMGCLWTMHTGLPGVGTATAKSFIWHKTAIGYAAAKDAANVAGNGSVAAFIDWIPERVSYLVNHLMSGGAVLIDTTGVIELNSDDTAAIATS